MLKRIVIWGLSGLMLLLCCPAFVTAAAGSFKKISAPETRALIEEGKVLVVNVLSRVEFDVQHIPGSINIPINEIEKSDLLPADYSAPIIFYCMGTS